ncbi:hypothetical protein [Agriterribacter sp.]|uniref:hypothetical protein n=1 Tax=Agriterribacter sp. TaxID=2821509 RepID=UPI002C5F7BA1|nr:hypothetical protein [Agriterribacter sp.]HRO47179.1 hypothetical protein [Agriterribacter sp.]HRQ18706.1 hypothetical protein [Agriterribacter sp.]
MDTDELSSEAYEGIIVEAEKFNHDLSLPFGLLASSCENEQEYLIEAKKLITEIKALKTHELSGMFFDAVPDKKDLHQALDGILANIFLVEKIPEGERHYDF